MACAAVAMLVSSPRVEAAAVLELGSSAAPPTLRALTIIAPAAPGGGWDQLAREMQREIDRQQLAAAVQVENVPGAAGTIGLAQLINARRGDGEALLVNGLVMLGAILWNESPVSISQVTPIARLTGEYEIVAVPAASPHHDMQSLVRALRENPAAVSWGGGSARRCTGGGSQQRATTSQAMLTCSTSETVIPLLAVVVRARTWPIAAGSSAGCPTS